MSDDIDIEYGGRRILSIRIVRDLPNLHGVRTASGVELQVPIVLTLLTVPSNEPRVIVNNLYGKVFVKLPDDSLISVGRLRWPHWESAGIASADSYYYPRETTLEWIATFADIAYLEKIRDGGRPVLQMSLQGDWCFLLPVVEENASERSVEDTAIETGERKRRYPSLYYRTDPMRVYCGRGYIEVLYAREVWIQMIRRLGIAENVLVEVPLPSSPTGDWNEVWKALVEARSAFEQGGTTGWKGCVTSVRLALEKWQRIEPEKPGAGWQPPKPHERQTWTKRERLDAMRWHVYQLAHLGAHTAAEDWSRDDALLMLSTLSALLAERKP